MSDNLNEVLLSNVKDAIYPSRVPISVWKCKEGQIPNAYAANLNEKGWNEIIPPSVWGGFDKTVWFRTNLSIPPEWRGKRVALLLHFPEAMVYVNGKPFQGVDKNHSEVVLTHVAPEFGEYQIAIEAYSGRRKEQHQLPLPEVAVLDKNARALYQALELMNELQHSLANPLAKELKELVRRTLVYVKYYKPGSEEYPNAIGRALRFLLTSLETEQKTDINAFIHLVGHSHIDVAWLWTIQETARKCGRTFSTVLRQMEEFPEFTFAQSQAYLYELTQQHHPHVFKQMKEHVQEGRWESLGGMWVEPDCNIPNGESLVRQILYGKQFFKKEFGIDHRTAWLPDSFGFSHALPQILKKSGIDQFVTTKMLWNDSNDFPHSTFWWEGLDGSRVLAHIPPAGIEGHIKAKDLLKNVENNHEFEMLPETLQLHGYGDGGGGPVKEQIDLAPVIKTLISLPPSGLSSVREFFSRIADRTANLPVWKDELYLEKHRGTFTTHGWIKKENRECEVLAYNAELLAVLGQCIAKGGLRKYPRTELEAMWKKLLVNQFHDIVPGTAIEPVYQEARKSFEEFRTAAASVIDAGLIALTEKAKPGKNELVVTLINTLAWERSEYVELELKTNQKVLSARTADGKPVPCQVLGKNKEGIRCLCYLESVPAFGSITLFFTQAEPASVEADWNLNERNLGTPFYKIRFDKKGQISSIYDKRLRRELLKKGGRGNNLLTFRDTPQQWDAWDLESDYRRHKLDLLQFKSQTLAEQGPLRTTIAVEFSTAGGSTIKQQIRFYHKSPRIDFATTVQWHEKQVLVKAAFPLNTSAKNACFETQFGVVTRTMNPSTAMEEAKFEVPVQQWMDVSDQKCGVSLLNDSKYGADIESGVMRLTLLRSPYYPHPTEPWRLNDVNSTDQGAHHFTYAIYPHKGDWRQAETVRRAREFNTPLLVRHGVKGKAEDAFIDISHAGVLLDAIKMAEEGDRIIIRMHETFGAACSTTLTFGPTVKEASECDLMENDLQTVKLNKNKLVVKFKPFEIKTLKVLLKK